jgi:hypothetical protein
MVDQRIQNEIEHGKFLASHNAGEIWNWETPAGKIRWDRRVGMLTDSLKSGMKVLEIGCGIGLSGGVSFKQLVPDISYPFFRKFDNFLVSPHFNLTIELPLKAIIRGYSYKVVSNTWRNRKYGQSKLKETL